MAGISKLFFMALFLGLMSRATLGQQSCHTSDLKISQVATGKKVESKPEWNITIFNSCICTQDHIQLSCPGFQTVEKIDPSILSKDGDICSLADTNVIHVNESFSFTYAWDTPYPFKPFFSDVYCS